MSAFQQLLLGARRAGIGERLAAATAAAVMLVAAVAVLVPGESRSRQRGVAEGIAREQTTGSTAQASTAEGSTAQGGVARTTGAGGASGSPEVAGAGPGSAPNQGGPRGNVAMGPGVTATTIKLGFTILPTSARDAQKALAGAGGETTAFGDERDAVDTIIAYLNAHGGIAGRKVTPVYYESELESTSAVNSQKACSTFTQDNRVFAAVSALSGDGYAVLAGCLAKAKTIYVASRPHGIIDQVILDRFAPYFYSPGLLRGERFGAVIDQLVAGKYFDKGAKLGVVWTDDEPTGRIYKGVAQRRLAAHGLKVTADAPMSPVYGSADYGTVSREMNQAVLRFSQAGVTHVLFFASNGWGPFMFLPAAESQGYRPRYAMTSLENIQGQVPQSPKAQFHRSLAVGWWPTFDVDWAQDPKDNPAQDQCEKIIRQAGVNMGSRFGFASFNGFCDGLFFLKAALGRAGELTPAGFRSAVDRLGTTYRSPMTYATRFEPGRFDAANATRLLAFDDGCGCYKYTGKWQSIP